jgi:adenosylhomocysteine nucleosidase
MIAILVAVQQELRPILRRADANHLIRQAHFDFYEGTFAGQPVALLALGVGRDCARIAAEKTIECYRPDLIICAGFGGALQDAARPGDVVVGTTVLEVVEDQGHQVLHRTVAVLPAIPDLTATVGGFRVHHGPVLTTEEIVLRATTRQRLQQATGAMVVDMETSAVVRVCAARGTRVLAVRSITDGAKENLPEALNDFFMLGQLQLGRIFTACNRNPRVLFDLIRLGFRAQRAGANLAHYLQAALPHLE